MLHIKPLLILALLFIKLVDKVAFLGLHFVQIIMFQLNAIRLYRIQLQLMIVSGLIKDVIQLVLGLLVNARVLREIQLHVKHID